MSTLVGLCCRTSERVPTVASGVEALAPALGEHLGGARLVGSSGEARTARWEDDLRDSRGCLLEAGGQVDDALSAGRVPLLLAGDPSIALTTLPTVVDHRPDTVILWLDAHGCFNTPETSSSGYLAGMAVAGACGRWDAGLAKREVLEDRVVLAGVRDLDTVEQSALAKSDVTVIGASPHETLVAVVNALSGAPVYVHLDFDVLDPDLFEVAPPVSGGLSPDKLHDVLDAVAESCEIVGVEMTGFSAPATPPGENPVVDGALESMVEQAMHMLGPLFHAIPQGANVPN